MDNSSTSTKDQRTAVIGRKGASWAVLFANAALAFGGQLKKHNPMQKTAFGLAIVFLLASCSKPMSPAYAGYNHLRIEKVGFKNTVVAADLKLYNPNKYDLQVKSAEAKVYFNGHLLGRTYFDTVVVLRSRDTTYLPLQLQATAGNILTNGVRVLLNRNVNVKIEGKIKAGRHGFFVNVPVNYEGMQHIRFTGKDTAATSSQRKYLQRRLVALLLQQIKTPVQIIEATLLMLDFIDQKKPADSGRNKTKDTLGVKDVPSIYANTANP